MKGGLKRWSVNAFLEGMNPVNYYCDGRPLAGDSRAEREAFSPLQHVLVGVAGCLALNCRAVMQKKQIKGVDLEVVVSGERRSDAENRLSALVVTTIFRGSLSSNDARAILEQAKPLCTVANTFLSAPRMLYETHTIKPSSRVVDAAVVASDRRKIRSRCHGESA